MNSGESAPVGCIRMDCVGPLLKSSNDSAEVSWIWTFSLLMGNGFCLNWWPLQQHPACLPRLSLHHQLFSTTLQQNHRPTTNPHQGHYIAKTGWRNRPNMPDEPDQPVSTVAVKVPPFWPHDVELWFLNLEGQFALAKITAQITKFHYVVGNLPPEYSHNVRQFLKDPQDATAYGPFHVL